MNKSVFEIKCRLEASAPGVANSHAYAKMRRLRHRAPAFNEHFDRYRVLFVHIPKTGGSSIAIALTGNRKTTHSHLSLHDYYAANKQKAAMYTKFCVVRNPWDRLVSAFEYLKNLPSWVSSEAPTRWFADNYVAGRSFDVFVSLLYSKPWLLRWPHLRPQLDFISLHGDIAVDNILHFEHINDEFADFARRHALPNALCHDNRSQRKRQYQTYYNKEATCMVYSMYKQDCIAFDYTPDNNVEA